LYKHIPVAVVSEELQQEIQIYANIMEQPVPDVIENALLHWIATVGAKDFAEGHCKKLGRKRSISQSVRSVNALPDEAVLKLRFD